MYYSCLKHLEMILDDFVDEFEEAPDVLSLEEASSLDRVEIQKCRHCGEEAKFYVRSCR